MLKPRSHLQHLHPYELPKNVTRKGVVPLTLAQNENYANASEYALEAARGASHETRYRLSRAMD